MKKLIAAAVATSVSAIALADVSITGNANYEYFAKEDTTGFKTNYADTEVNLSVKGKSGDTSVVANIEIDKSSDTATESIDVEDLYLTTKVGDFTIKAGDYASSTTALAGEIEEGSRSKNKVTIGTKIGDASVSYALLLNQSLMMYITQIVLLFLFLCLSLVLLSKLKRILIQLHI